MKVVLCGVHVVECLRLAGVYREDFAKATRCRAQAASLMREERAAARMLAQEQKLRRAGAAVAEASASAAPARPAVASAPLPSAAPEAPPPQVQATEAAPHHAAPAPLRPAVTRAAPPVQAAPARAASAAPPSPEAIAKAEAFAQDNIVAAAQIRHDRGIAPEALFRDPTLPADWAMIDALVRGTSDVLTMLDEIGGAQLNAAASRDRHGNRARRHGNQDSETATRLPMMPGGSADRPGTLCAAIEPPWSRPGAWPRLTAPRQRRNDHRRPTPPWRSRPCWRCFLPLLHVSVGRMRKTIRLG